MKEITVRELIKGETIMYKKVEISSDGECVCFEFVPSEKIIIELTDLVKREWGKKDTDILKTEIFVNFNTSVDEDIGIFDIWFDFAEGCDLYVIDRKVHNDLYAEVIVEMLMVQKELYQNAN